MGLFCAFFLLPILGGVIALPSSNNYMDNVIHIALQNVLRNEKLDPTHLPSYTFEYKDKTFIGSVNGKADYTNGTLSGLSRVSRINDCSGPSNISGYTVINCTFAFNYLKTEYSGKVKYGVLPKISIKSRGDVSTTVVFAEIAQPLSSNRPQVRKFGFVRFGSIDTHFTGLGPLNKHMKVLEENYRSRVSEEVRTVMSNRFRYALQLAVEQVPMPKN